MSKGAKRPYAEILPIAEHLRDVFAPYCHRIEIAGSLRRERPYIGDIELVGVPIRPYKAQASLFDPPTLDLKAATSLDTFLAGTGIQMALNGPKLKRFNYRGIQVDLFLPYAEDYGWRFTFSTGSSEFNRWLVTEKQWEGAMPHGMKSEDGSLWLHGERLVVEEEAEAFDLLGLPFIPLHKRDDKRWLS